MNRIEKRTKILSELASLSGQVEICTNITDIKYNNLKWIEYQIEFIEKTIYSLKHLINNNDIVIEFKKPRDNYVHFIVDLNYGIVSISMHEGFEGKTITDCISSLISKLKLLKKKCNYWLEEECNEMTEDDVAECILGSTLFSIVRDLDEWL